MWWRDWKDWKKITDEREPERWKEHTTLPFSVFVTMDDSVIISSKTSRDDIAADVQIIKGTMEIDKRKESDDEEDSQQIPICDSKEAVKMLSGL